MSAPPTCEACLQKAHRAEECPNLKVVFCKPCRDHGHACECYGGDITCDPDPSIDEDRITDGWCPDLSQTHTECGGRCGHPEDHLCDAPYPEQPEIRCIEGRGHDGDCMGPNGPSWDTPEPYDGYSPVRSGWSLRPGLRKRPEDEETLEAFA